MAGSHFEKKMKVWVGSEMPRNANENKSYISLKLFSNFFYFGMELPWGGIDDL